MVILISASLVCENFLFDGLRERVLGSKTEGDEEAKWMFLMTLIIAWKAEIVAEAAFDRLL